MGPLVFSRLEGKDDVQVPLIRCISVAVVAVKNVDLPAVSLSRSFATSQGSESDLEPFMGVILDGVKPISPGTW